MQWKRGITREVFLIGRWAIKIPSFRSWKLFLQGLLGNMQEKQWSGFDERLCPVVFYTPGGFLSIMPRATPIECINDEYLSICDSLPVEKKLCSFGLLNGKIVAVDYGS